MYQWEIKRSPKIVALTCKVGTHGRGGRSASPSFPGHAGLCGVFPTIFVLYSNDLPSEALSSRSAI